MNDVIMFNLNTLHAQLCRELAKTNDVQRISNEFNALISNYEKVIFSFNLLKVNHLLPPIIKDKKCDIEAIEFKHQGNTLFEAKKYYEAFKKYNQCISHANITDAEVLPQAYTNRAMIFLGNKMYEECLKDIKNALKYKTSPQLHKKLLEMEKKALKHKGKKSHQEDNEYFTKMPELKTKSEIFDCASGSIKLETSEELGRHIVATKEILPGEIIAIEKPYSAILLQEFFCTHCFQCFKSSFNLIPCLNCTSVMFCSLECRETSSRHHKHECPFLLTLSKLGVTKLQFLALRVVICARNYYENVSNLKILEHGKYFSGRYQEIHYLVSNQDKRSASDIFKRATTAAVFYHILLSTNFFDNFSNEKLDDVKHFVAENLLHHLQTAPSNMHEIAELNGTSTSEDGFQCEEIGAGAYAFMSLLNHSCSPNVVRHCFGTTMVLRALRPIAPGQQLFDNYGYHHALMSRAERRQALKAQYHFECNCEACEHDWGRYDELRVTSDEPVVTESELEALRHGDRHTALALPQKLLALAIELDSSAPSRNLSDVQEVLKQCWAIMANKRTLSV